MAKVLLVEDDNNLREIYEARLSAEGYEITTAQNGEEALSVAKDVKPDLIISDVMMPRISGFEMLDILRNTNELKDTKVIMLTALGQTEDRGRADNLGADKYLVKSQVTLEDIVNASHELLDDTTPGATVAPVAPVSDPVPAATAVVAQPAATPDAPAPVAVVSEPVAAVAPATSDPVVQTPPAQPMVADPAVPTPSTTVTVADPDPIMPTPVVDTPAPQPPAPAQQYDAATAANDAVLTDAINKLTETEAVSEPAQVSQVTSVEPTIPEMIPPNPVSQVPPAPSPETAPVATVAPTEPAPVPAPEPQPEVASYENPQAVAGRKIIEPINEITGPDLNSLLAQEEAREAAEATGSVITPTNPPAQTAPAPQNQAVNETSAIDPNSIAL